jgi:hypothetical protein
MSFSRNMKGKYYVEDLVIDDGLVLICMLKKRDYFHLDENKDQ